MQGRNGEPRKPGNAPAVAYALAAALTTLGLAGAALFLQHAALRMAAVLLCAGVLALCMTARLRRRMRALRRETERYRSDCTRARERESLLRQRSELDPLTQTLNRAAFTERAAALMADESRTHAFLMLDLDNFKQVNDTCGHDAGDRTLIEVASSIRAVLRPQDLLCRIGGDEFAILLLEVGDDAVIARRAAELCRAVRRTVCQLVPLSASVGASVFPRDGCQVPVLYAKADSSLYRSKHLGKDGFSLFEPPPHQA